MILAIDFDGVIHDKAVPIPGRRMGAPLPGAKEAIDTLYHRHTIIIHTVMANTPGGKKAVADWMTYWKIPYHTIEPKLVADKYIDDKAIKHTNWPQTITEL